MLPRAPPAPSSRQRANAAPTGSGSISLPHIPGVPCRGNVSTPCVPRGQVVAIFRRGAFSGGDPWHHSAAVPFSGARRWQNAREMRSPGVRQWQDLAAMRFRAVGHGSISPWCVFGGSSRGEIMPRCVPERRSVAAFSLHAFPKGPRTGKAPVRGNISPPCIRNELASARYARHASEKPRKSPSEDTPREDLARKGPFSLRGPFRSCTARGSCRRSALERERIGQSQKIAGILTRTRSKVVTSY